MTVSSESIKSGPHEGNGVATSFSFTFKTFQASDLTVILEDSSGNLSTLTLDSDYSVTLNADQDVSPGGSITYPLSGSPLAASNYLTVYDEPAYTQSTDFVDGGSFRPEVIEAALDRLTLLVQQLKEEVGRAPRLAQADDRGITVDLPTPQADRLLGWDATGKILSNLALAGVTPLTVSAFMETLLADSTALAGRTTLGAEQSGICMKKNAPIYAHVSAVTVPSVATELASIDIGTVALNDLILLQWFLQGTKNTAPGDLVFTLEQKSGTGSVVAFQSYGYKVDTKYCSTFGGVVQFSGQGAFTCGSAGTAVLRLKGSSAGGDLTSSDISLTAVKLTT